MNYNTLENTSIEKLHTTFVEAFSDYQVKIDLPISKFENMLKQRGYIGEVSIGAFDEDTLVGFILNAIRYWDGKLTVYDTGTGVIKDYRNKGITSNMFLNIVQILKEKNIKQYLLEVIQSNESAVYLYKKQGFEISRKLECFKLDKSKYNSDSIYQAQHMDKIDNSTFEEVMEFWDFNPSWQNSIDSINAISDDYLYSVVRIDNIIVGYGIINKNTGDIAQLAVHQNYRGKGIGRSIFTDLLSRTPSNHISVTNVDSECDSMKSFLENLGFEQIISQYEMILKFI